VILFSFTAPYYLDATDISKLTAYYVLYSKQPAFVDVAARILFQQATLQGASPVSIPAMEYDLIKETSPDPDQIIALQLDQASVSLATPITTDGITPEPTPVPSYKIGDSITVRAGPVLDHNHHLVPDGTVVRFTLSTRDELGSVLQEVTTQEGIARASFVIDKPGNVEVRAVSESAVISDVLQFDATNEGVAVTVVPVITETPSLPPTPTPTAIPEDEFISPDGYPRSGIWFLVLLGVLGSTLLTYWAVSRVTTLRWGLRFAMGVLIGGFGAYNYLALGFPRALEWISSDSGGAFGVLLFTLAGEALGIILMWVWFRWFSESASQED
jgi:beta-N-acetylhexosaminidase